VISRIETDGLGNKAMDLKRFSGDPEFMLSLAKGLVVLEAFGSEMDCPTIAKLSTVTGPQPSGCQTMPVHAISTRICERG
jgi:hypothetical protein